MPQARRSLTALITVAWAVSACVAPASGLKSSLLATPPSDLQLSPPGEKLAARHAHLVTARLLEESGKPREALPHYLAFVESGIADSELMAHVADLVVAYRDLNAAAQILENQIKEHPRATEPFEQFIRFALKHAD